MSPDQIGLVMAGLLSLGGAKGYFSKGSKASLIAGVGLGGLYMYSSRLMNTNSPNGVPLALAASALLLASSVPRLAKTRKPLPLMLTVLGAASTAYYYRQWV
ncbi:hypothetical protein SPOG_02136 [Schizosaccharomyces cryophilus OY26]|uniref:Transmembrane protein 14 n=1 Tax=Schizosaccharomyces cryophilus (strain OY26 / ATCC MYA-4695 / CBS 11777 / NBRC 106824 / NRRL Y48691) TaxID=653667 RepID=S9X6Y4_SCHCR|nr:uncharacterized protein SPOG_02136 [Schizosaccharomyces cryophilus OY26]EPY52817.1 hypothetical protein SPOG_02136 [Schizosaccharomyces cryophilus OY26]